MREAYRVLKQDRVAIMFCGWNKVDAFFAAWKSAGFQPIGHIVFRKTYASKTRFLSYRHEQAYLLARADHCFRHSPLPMSSTCPIPATSCIPRRNLYKPSFRWFAASLYLAS